MKENYRDAGEKESPSGGRPRRATPQDQGRSSWGRVTGSKPKRGRRSNRIRVTGRVTRRRR